MSFVRLGLKLIANANHSQLQRVTSIRNISQSCIRFQTSENENVEEQVKENELSESAGPRMFRGKPVPPEKDRSKVISVETSIRYLKSSAYKQTYGDNPVWKLYRRNHKGQRPPSKTRKTCIREDTISTGSPCPICRDEYLVFDHTNLALLKQFISPYNGELLSYQKTNICQKQHGNLLVAIHKAKDYGTLTYEVPFRKYDYNDWYNPEKPSLDTIESEDKNQAASN